MKASLFRHFRLFAVITLVTVITVAACFIAHADSTAPGYSQIGDVYDDGSITTKDGIYLLQYLAHMVEIPSDRLFIANTFIGDDYADGSPNINTKDAIILLQYLAKMDVVLGGEQNWRLVKAPTFQEQGEITRRINGIDETVPLPCLNETDYEIYTSKEAVCFAEGERVFRYHKDHQTFEFSVPLPIVDHFPVTVNAVEPTCQTNGLTEGSQCLWCGKVYVAQQSIPALSHSYIHVSGVAPTCTSTGLTEGSRCVRCSEWNVPQEILPMLPHTYPDGSWTCQVCQHAEYTEYTLYSDFLSACTSSENGNVVTLRYDSSASAGLNLHLFALDSNKTYIFTFGSNAGKIRISSNGATYSNVRIIVESRDDLFDLTLHNIHLQNKDTVISSSAYALSLAFYGDSCSVQTQKGESGAAGKSGESFVTSAIHGHNGSNANDAIVCNGIINLICASPNVKIKGGDGGNGGHGGTAGGAGADGGNGGHGGNGAMAIRANVIQVEFQNSMNRSNISILGGSGGTGGSGGDGTFGFWIADGKDGTPGNTPSPSQASSITIIYID